MVPLGEVATLTDGNAYSIVRRVDRAWTVAATADCSPGTNPEAITREMNRQIEATAAAFSGVSIGESGLQADRTKALASLLAATLAALLMIDVILAWLFSNYTQPFAMMLAIPFSLIGFVAIDGVVVNKSLFLVERSNAATRSGQSLPDSLIDAGSQRLRPSFLTTVTTLLGLRPLLLDQSFQARVLIPIAISITAGLASATLLTLRLLPAMILIIDNMKCGAPWLWYGRPRDDNPHPGTMRKTR